MDSIDEDVTVVWKRRQKSKVVEGEDGSEHVVNASAIIEATTNFKSIQEGDN